MPITVPAEVTFSDEILEILRGGSGAPLAPAVIAAAAPPLAEGERYLDVEFPDWVLIDERLGETYQWPKVPPEVYDPFTVYEGTTSRGSIRMGIGRCQRTQTWGRDRVYLITFLITKGGKRPLCEFLATDDYATTGETVAIIRGLGRGRSMYGPSNVLPSPYRHLRIENYRDRIDFSGSWNKQAVVAHEDDAATMLNHSLIQADLRFNIRPS